MPVACNTAYWRERYCGK